MREVLFELHILAELHHSYRQRTIGGRKDYVDLVVKAKIILLLIISSSKNEHLTPAKLITPQKQLRPVGYKS